MSEIIVGQAQLEGRLRAVANADKTGSPMKQAALAVVAQLKRNIPRATGKTGASIIPMAITESSAEVWGSKVAKFLDQGTGLYGPKHHVIVPTSAAVLAFHYSQKGTALGATYRLTGRMSVASARKVGGDADMVFVRSVKGMQARPYIERSVQQAVQQVGTKISATIVSAWDGGAA